LKLHHDLAVFSKQAICLFSMPPLPHYSMLDGARNAFNGETMVLRRIVEFWAALPDCSECPTRGLWHIVVQIAANHAKFARASIFNVP